MLQAGSVFRSLFSGRSEHPAMELMRRFAQFDVVIVVGQGKPQRPEHAAEAVEGRGLRLQLAAVLILRPAPLAANDASLH